MGEYFPDFIWTVPGERPDLGFTSLGVVLVVELERVVTYFQRLSLGFLVVVVLLLVEDFEEVRNIFLCFSLTSSTSVFRSVLVQRICSGLLNLRSGALCGTHPWKILDGVNLVDW